MAGEEVLEGLVQEVDEVRVVGDARRVEVAEADEDGGGEHGDAAGRSGLAAEVLHDGERQDLGEGLEEASPSSAEAAVGSPK